MIDELLREEAALVPGARAKFSFRPASQENYGLFGGIVALAGCRVRFPTRSTDHMLQSRSITYP